MRDSIIVDMKYADLDIINGQYGVERHHCLGGPNRKKADEDFFHFSYISATKKNNIHN